MTAEAITESSGRLPQPLGKAALDFFQKLSLPAFYVDRPLEVYMVNPALANVFGYESVKAAEEFFRECLFFSTHFSSDTIASFYERAAAGRLDGWLMRGTTLDGREVALELHADISLVNSEGRIKYASAFFTTPGDFSNAKSLLEKAKHEAELAVRAKTEFLSNISHELRTPLNIIIGMLNMAVDDAAIGREIRENLILARNAADGLFAQISDLILLTNLEAHRLTSEATQFTPELLALSLTRKFEALALEKNIRLRIELDEFRDGIFEGGYNLISMALEKLVHNAIRFNRVGGEVVIKAGVSLSDDGAPWLHCEVADEGPGLADCFLNGLGELFRQGDASMSRQHGGLGLGLRLAGRLVRHLGGEMRLNNRAEGGARPNFSVPIAFSELSP